jgi:large subunit ribosomal protein L15
MKLFALHSIIKRRKKRVGRGHGSGKVKTSGRGTKGQNARGHMPPGFEGGQLSLIKRLPLLRGKDRNKSQKQQAFPIHVKRLGELPKGTTISLATFHKYHMIDKGVSRVKILGKGKLPHALTVTVPCSKNARYSIEQAGGTIEAK